MNCYCQPTYILRINFFWLAARIFAYGQTSSVNTCTMIGITKYSVMDIYEYIEKVCVCVLGITNAVSFTFLR
jgi:hypothetical protein